MRIKRCLAALAVAALAAFPSTAQSLSLTPVEILSFEELDGWPEEGLAEAFSVFTATCRDMRSGDWVSLCSFASSDPEPRAFFELFFRPVRLGGGVPALFTGYYEPELRASTHPTDVYRYPLYLMPPEARGSGQWLSRAEIENGNALHGRDLEIGWLADPVDLYFLQIQGSGRLRMSDGSRIRIGYAGTNGHPWRPVPAEIVRRGIYESHQASHPVIRNWVRRNPDEGRSLLQHDPSYVFFRILDEAAAIAGPRGAMNRPLTGFRSLAVDPAHTPLGAPVWIEVEGSNPLRRLMIAQDTGGAIRGPQRGDIFYGTGSHAQRAAQIVRNRGQMIVLMPIEQAFALALGG